MTWRRILFLVLACGFAAASAGCHDQVRDLVGHDPEADGAWTGRVITIDVTDDNGRHHEVVGMTIDDGPRILRSSPGMPTSYAIPDDAVVFLTRREDAYRAIHPASFGAPIGARVRARGRMYMGLPVVVVRDLTGPATERVTVRDVTGQNSQLRLQLRSKPQLLPP